MMRRAFLVAVASLCWAAAHPATQARGGCEDGCCQVTCPSCRHVCKLEVEQEKVKKHCWEVECKAICIPKVRFPWQSCCEPLCATVKHVNVLKKKEYECEKCKYKWSAVEVPCGGCGDCAAAIGGPQATPAEPAPQPQPAAPQAAPSPGDRVPMPATQSGRSASGGYYRGASLPKGNFGSLIRVAQPARLPQ